MNRNGCAIFLVILIFFIGSASLFQPRVASGDDVAPIRFLWSFCALTGPENRSEIAAVTKDIELRTGDRIKFFLQPVSASYLYVLYRSSQGELKLLFPSSLSSRDTCVGKQHLIPEGNQWFTLDEHSGPETFYLIASTKRLDQLENLIGRHLNPAGNEDPAISAEAVITEVKHLRKQHLKLTALAERPVRLGGNLRGTAELQPDLDIRRLAVEILAQDFFCRTFTIDHQ